MKFIIKALGEINGQIQAISKIKRIILLNQSECRKQRAQNSYFEVNLGKVIYKGEGRILVCCKED